MNLYLVATPIGNLSDMSSRAVETLQKVNLVLAEDTRKTGLLLKHFGINTQMQSLHEHNEIVRIPEVINWLKSGRDVALVSDAGTPTISDPGYKLVREAIEQNIKIISIPGPSAVITALTVSGLPTEHFIYIGYLPKTAGKANKILSSLKTSVEKLPATIIFFESPHRLVKTLQKLSQIFPDSKIAVTRELTKIHEEVTRGNTGEVFKKLEKVKPKGEYTLVLRD